MTDATQPLDAQEQSPATTCLDGIRCPACGSTQRFMILATVDVTMIDNGTDDSEGTSWDDSSPITCAGCQHTGTVGGFKAPEALTCRQCGGDVFVTTEGTAHHWAPSDAMWSDHGSYVDHDLDADHVAVPDLIIDDHEGYLRPDQPDDEAVQTTQVSPAQLVGGETIVGDAGGHLVISGEVYASNAMPGMYAVENEFGTLYLDADLPVQIVVE